MSIAHETPDRHNILTRLIDLVAFCERAYRRLDDSMLGHYFLERRRARKLRKSR